MARPGEWSTLFSAAFRQSRNAMVLVDSERRHVEVNGAYLKLLGYRREELIGHPLYEFVVGGPVVTAAEWQQLLRTGRFSGEARVRCANSSEISVQWAATAEVITGRRLVLGVVLSTSRWGRSFRRVIALIDGPSRLTDREREIVRLMAMGSTGPEIADELGISHDTVRTHARNAMTKVGARSRAHLVAKALGEGLVWSGPEQESSS